MKLDKFLKLLGSYVLKKTKRAARVFVFRNLSRKLLPFAFRRASGRKAGINAISYDVKNPRKLDIPGVLKL